MKRYPAEAVCQWQGGCDERPVARGLCKKHYNTAYNRTWQNPEIAQPLPARVLRDNRGKPCMYCDRPAASRGLCRPHYKRMWRRGMLEVRLPEVSVQP